MAERDEAASVQLKFRVKERLRAELEQAARQHGTSLNAEIVARLEQSFEARPELEIHRAGFGFGDAWWALSDLQSEVLGIAGKLHQSEHQQSIIKIAQDMTTVQKMIHSAMMILSGLVSIPKKETSK